MRVSVVGAGVVGLITAWFLHEAGHAVALVADRPWTETVSAVAAGLWYPHGDEPTPRVIGWSRFARGWWAERARDPASGVRVVRLREWHRTPVGRPWWEDQVPRLKMLPASGPWVDGFEVEVPVVHPPTFLGWLERALVSKGVTRRPEAVVDLEAPVGEARVVCAGLGAGPLVPDASLVGVRGQVVVVRAPWIERATLDPAHPEGLLYVVPRCGDVVLGGTMTAGDDRTSPDPAVTERILRCAADVEPSLRGVQVLAERVGHRPWRPTVRLEWDPIRPRVLHHYGHGSSGFALAPGSAREVVRLLAR